MTSVSYTPPAGLGPTLSFKGYLLNADKLTELPDEIAGWAVAQVPGVKVVKGNPTPWKGRKPGSVRAELAREREAVREFHRDPRRLLDELPDGAEGVKALLSAKAADRATLIESGKLDDDLVWVVLVARLAGLTEAAEIAVLRAESLRLQD